MQDIRNIAIIAHVDHGKTTLIDTLLRDAGAFKKNKTMSKRVMDSNPQERERGITIFAKNASYMHGGCKVNIIDTPGHADFGGEVERILKMADGALLLVDACEGPMPQTKFVLRKALEEELKILIVVNKIDRPSARPLEVLDEVLDLLIHLGAPDEYLDFPYVFTSAKDGVSIRNIDDAKKDMNPLLDMILSEIPSPTIDKDKPFQMLVTSLDYSDYLGKISIGRIFQGTVKSGDSVAILAKNVPQKNAKVRKVFSFESLDKIEVHEAYAGDIIAIAGLDDIMIGHTISSPSNPIALDSIEISEPTVSIQVSVNDSPFSGREGKHVTSRSIKARLFKETITNVSLRAKELDAEDSIEVSGRGELHLSVLIETMRREGFEMAISSPKVVFKKNEHGKILEPIEMVTIDVPSEYIGFVVEKMGRRKADMKAMKQLKGGLTRIEFEVPTRSLLGFSSTFAIETKGEGILTRLFKGYEEYKGDLVLQDSGALISSENGEVVAYALSQLSDRGYFFVSVGDPIYKGMVVGANNRSQDLSVNLCKTKKLTNMRSSGSDDALKLIPPRKLTLEIALETVKEDELVEVTPKSVRIRKKILNETMRLREKKRKKTSLGKTL